jgi:hypothetical protein
MAGSYRYARFPSTEETNITITNLGAHHRVSIMESSRSHMAEIPAGISQQIGVSMSDLTSVAFINPYDRRIN